MNDEDPNPLIAALCENALELREGLPGARVEIGLVRSEMIDCEPADHDERGLNERAALERLLAWCVEHGFILTAQPGNRHVRISYLPHGYPTITIGGHDASAAFEDSGPMIVLRVAKST